MKEGKRQKQISAEILKQLNDIFLRRNLNMQNGGMVSIANVRITPDLQEARIYLSFFKVNEDDAVLEGIKSRVGEIRGELGKRMRHQLRVIPQLVFYKDDTLDHVFKMEKLLNDLKDESSGEQ